MTGRTNFPKHSITGFTILELLVAMAVLGLLFSLVATIITQSASTWRSTTNRLEAFQGARFAFDSMTRQLSQATLNTYWDYDNPNNPDRYRRNSELHFLAGTNLAGGSHAVFFQAPGGKTSESARIGGLDGLLNASGFFVKYGEEQIPPLSGLKAKKRFRLMQWTQDTKNLAVYQNVEGNEWIAQAMAEASPVADNIIALIIWPKQPEKDRGSEPLSYQYDSRFNATHTPQPATANQLPPIVQVTMVGIDGQSASRLDEAGQMEAFVEKALDSLFEDPEDYQADLATLEDRLADPSTLGFNNSAKGLEYRIFTSAVPMRESKWSKD